MRAFVFTDPSLERYAGRFVWLEINTEKAENAAFRRKHPVPALPTFFIVDPQEEKVLVRWVGGFTVAQFEQLLEENPFSAKTASRLDPMAARADSLYGQGLDEEAVAAYEEVLALASPDWPGYARTVDALMFALSRIDEPERCAALARTALPRLRHTPSAATVAASGLECALALSSDHPHRTSWVTELEQACREVLADTTLAIADDDRSGVYITVLGAREDARDEPGRLAVARAWSAHLDAAAARARTPDQRAVFDSHRLSAYLELGEPERAIPMLEASERDFPEDYNPPARLAIAYKALARWRDALAASGRALEKAYGPRRLLLLQNEADIYAGSGDSAAARRTLEGAVRYAEALPAGQRSERSIASLKKKLAAYR